MKSNNICPFVSGLLHLALINIFSSRSIHAVPGVRVSFFFFFPVLATVGLVDSLFPDQGLNSGSWQSERQVLLGTFWLL